MRAAIKGEIVSISVFDYIDYRQFLLDYYNAKKAANPHFSYRYICEHVGLKSKGHLAHIFKGETKISVKLALKFAEFLKFDVLQTEYFQTMVLFNDTKNPAERKRYLEKMNSCKEMGIATCVSADRSGAADKLPIPDASPYASVLGAQETQAVSMLTLPLSAAGFARAQDEIAKFRSKLKRISQDESQPDQVFQCSVHLLRLAVLFTDDKV